MTDADILISQLTLKQIKFFGQLLAGIDVPIGAKRHLTDLGLLDENFQPIASCVEAFRRAEKSFGLSGRQIRQRAERAVENQDTGPVRQLLTQSRRVETGVVRFGTDWPGVFIRGDNALGNALHLAEVIEAAKQSGKCDILSIAVVEGLLNTLRSVDVSLCGKKGK